MCLSAGEEMSKIDENEALDVRLMCCNKKMRRCSAMIHDWTTGYGGMVVKASYWCFLCRTKKSVEHIG
jgi:hypothetical protein